MDLMESASSIDELERSAAALQLLFEKGASRLNPLFRNHAAPNRQVVSEIAGMFPTIMSAVRGSAACLTRAKEKEEEADKLHADTKQDIEWKSANAAWEIEAKLSEIRASQQNWEAKVKSLETIAAKIATIATSMEAVSKSTPNAIHMQDTEKSSTSEEHKVNLDRIAQLEQSLRAKEQESEELKRRLETTTDRIANLERRLDLATKKNAGLSRRLAEETILRVYITVVAA